YFAAYAKGYLGALSHTTSVVRRYVWRHNSNAQLQFGANTSWILFFCVIQISVLWCLLLKNQTSQETRVHKFEATASFHTGLYLRCCDCDVRRHT
ncbi:unnamed protein product, partial [Callosobruchus maculatus]